MLFRREMGWKIHNGEVNVCVGEGRLCRSVQSFKLLDGGLFSILVLIVNPDRKYHDLGGWIWGCFFTYLKNMVKREPPGSSPVGCSDYFCLVNVQVPHNYNRFLTLEWPVLQFSMWSGQMGCWSHFSGGEGVGSSKEGARRLSGGLKSVLRGPTPVRAEEVDPPDLVSVEGSDTFLTTCFLLGGPWR